MRIIFRPSRPDSKGRRTTSFSFQSIIGTNIRKREKHGSCSKSKQKIRKPYSGTACLRMAEKHSSVSYTDARARTGLLFFVDSIPFSIRFRPGRSSTPTGRRHFRKRRTASRTPPVGPKTADIVRYGSYGKSYFVFETRTATMTPAPAINTGIVASDQTPRIPSPDRRHDARLRQTPPYHRRPDNENNVPPAACAVHADKPIPPRLEAYRDDAISDDFVRCRFQRQIVSFRIIPEFRYSLDVFPDFHIRFVIHLIPT